MEGNSYTHEKAQTLLSRSNYTYVLPFAYRKKLEPAWIEDWIKVLLINIEFTI